MAMSFVGISIGAVTPALADIAKAFPNAPATTISMLATIPPLFSMPCSLVSGKIVGKHVKFRTLAITGIVILFVGGVMPFFLQSLPLILFMRGFMGCGLGFVMPLGASITLNSLRIREAEAQMGRNAAIAGVGGIVFQMIGGYGSAISWRLCFLSYLMVVPVFLIILFCFSEPTYSEDAIATSSASQQKGTPKISTPLLLWGLLNGMFMVIFYSMITDLSGIIANNHIGTASESALVFSTFTLGSAIGSFIISKLITRIRKFTFVIGGLLCALGFFFFVVGHNLFLMFVGAIVHGFGFGMYLPAISLYGGMSVPPENRPFAISILNVMSAIGTFSSAYMFAGLRGLFHISNDRFAISVSAASYLLIAIGFLIHGCVRSERLRDRDERKALVSGRMDLQ
jgi:MFS family permease